MRKLKKIQLLNLKDKRAQRGSALVYILIAVALLAALTVTFMEPSSQQTQSQGSFRIVSQLSSQVEFMRATVQECILAHPKGDRGAMTAGVQNHNPYPLMPNSEYFDDECGANESTADTLMKDIRCPGDPGDDACHTQIFSGARNKFMPPAPDLFSDWRYYNGADGVFVWIQTDKTDAYLESAIDKIEEGYAKCEADKIVSAGSATDMTSDNANVVCPANTKCLRIWMKIDSTGGTPTYQESGC